MEGRRRWKDGHAYLAATFTSCLATGEKWCVDPSQVVLVASSSTRAVTSDVPFHPASSNNNSSTN